MPNATRFHSLIVLGFQPIQTLKMFFVAAFQLVEHFFSAGGITCIGFEFRYDLVLTFDLPFPFGNVAQHRFEFQIEF